MYCTNSGRKFIDYKVNLNDIRYVTVREEFAEDFEDTLNNLIEQLNKDGYKVVGISYKIDEVYFSAVVEYAAGDNIYYYKKEEVENDGQ